jgi:hypothetical protein
VAVSRLAPARLRTAALEEECLRLRREGLSHRQIASRLGIVPSTAYKRIRHGLSEVNERNLESATELRALETQRLDELQQAIWEQAAGGDLKAIDRILRIMERRAKLLGLDGPQRIEHAGAEGGPIQHEWDFSGLSDEELERQYRETITELEAAAHAEDQSTGC